MLGDTTVDETLGLVRAQSPCEPISANQTQKTWGPGTQMSTYSSMADSPYSLPS